MKKGLRESIDAVSPFWPLVLCVGLGGVIGSNRIWQEFQVPVLIITLSTTILIYGRIVSSMAPGSRTSPWTILKENWLNYVIAVREGPGRQTVDEEAQDTIWVTCKFYCCLFH